MALAFSFAGFDQTVWLSLAQRNEALPSNRVGDSSRDDSPFEQVADESRLAGRVLAHQQDHRLRVKVRVFQLGRVEVVKVIKFLQRQQLRSVDLLHLVQRRLHHLGGLILLSQPGKHLAARLILSNFTTRLSARLSKIVKKNFTEMTSIF